MHRARALLRIAVTLAMLIISAGAAAAHPGQHGEPTGHLLGTGEWGKIELVGQLTVSDAEPGLIADVAVFGDYAYLARWGGEACAGPEGGGPDGGVYVVDISDLANPVEVGFIRTHQDTLVGEGLQVVHLETAAFEGDVLVMNHEGCGKNFKAGVSLWDVTDPLKPKKLSEHFGDFTVADAPNRPHDANWTHSAFMWQAGDRAYMVVTDDDEQGTADVDIFDITNPKKPRLITELNLNQYGVSQPDLALTDSNLHDMVVKEIDGRFIMLLSYWDGGYVLLDVTDPANPVFLGDTDYPAVDPELFAQTGASLTPEGNAHQAEFTIDNRFIIATDEDFAPYRLAVTTEDGTFLAAIGTNTTLEQAAAITGTPVFVGRACPGDAAVPPAPDLPGDEIAVVERGDCFFTDKVAAVEAAGGYEAVIIMNREGSDACAGVITPSVEGSIPVIFVGRDTGYAMFDTPYDSATACADGPLDLAPIAIGALGDAVTEVGLEFDGWGYVHLYDAVTLEELDTFAIPEAMDPAFAEGFGDLSVHEVAVDPLDPSLAYLSYYAGGLRAIQIQCADEADTSTCELVEVGGYLDEEGNNFWGVETRVIDGQTFIFASDRDSGLWIFRDP
jgi:hypothetical protein